MRQPSQDDRLMRPLMWQNIYRTPLCLSQGSFLLCFALLALVHVRHLNRILLNKHDVVEREANNPKIAPDDLFPAITIFDAPNSFSLLTSKERRDVLDSSHQTINAFSMGQDESLQRQRIQHVSPQSRDASKDGSGLRISDSRYTSQSLQRLGSANSSLSPENLWSCTMINNRTWTIPKVPHFIIIGTQKAGTSALYYMLSQHPYLKPSRQRETHFFERGSLKNQTHQAIAVDSYELCATRIQYAYRWFGANVLNPDASLYRHEYVNKILFEKTVEYMALPHIPALLNATCFPDKPKIVVSLRNPIDRAYSQYKMDRGLRTESQVGSFENVVTKDIWLLRKQGLSKAPMPRWANPRNFVSSAFSMNMTKEEFSRAFLFHSFPNQTYSASLFDLPFGLTQKKRMEANRVSLLSRVGRGFYAQQIKNWHRYGFDQLLPIHYDDLQDRSNKTVALNAILQFVGAPSHANWKQATLDRDYSPNRVHKRVVSHREMKNETREYLRWFYQPYNDELADLLGNEWRHRWR